MHIKVGTRASKLALIQTNYVIEQIQKVYPSYTFEIIKISTKGDQIQNQSLSKIGDKGLFVSEIERKLVNREIDLAIHSMKDMPSNIPDSLIFCDCLKRENVQDCLIFPKGVTSLKEKPIIGTGSIRRKIQIEKLIPDCTCKDIRGNVDTRLRKLDEGQYDAIILAVAGLKRMNLESRISKYLDISQMIPATCQGALAIECRKEDSKLIQCIKSISDLEDTKCVQAERNFLCLINGSCHVPIGAYCLKNEKDYTFYAMYGKDEESVKYVQLKGQDPIALSIQASKELL